MEKQIRKFVDILKIELRDLEQDIHTLSTALADKLKEKEITNFVYKENTALLMREVRLVKEAMKDLNNFDFAQYEEIDPFIDDLQELFHNHLNSSAFPQAIHVLLTRKIEKVRDYIKL
ncbi:hypothetical protein [Spirochaeta cellobiosiphila]|uniref:hypothetical protein n=1 Tax=Spirochaeta cellobiosiphila TaxID=504483 RepID=UPI00041D2269|nr:hypothetical protein [Spirochaeta cellobiosiphila]